MCSPSACGPCSVAKLVPWRAQIAQGEACDLYIVDGAASAVGTDFGSRTPQPPSLLGQADCCVGQAIRHLGRESPFRSEICHSNPSRLCTRRFRHAAVGESPAAGTTSATVPLEEHDRIYFQSYSHIGIHEAMIKDRVRTDAYHTAIMYHQKFIEGKVVLDVGRGTGILSVFCARAGAKRVYAVEASEIATQACEIVKANNLADQIVVIHGRVEDVDLEEKVDVIISEWMGYMLLYESMLPSVLFARDKWLKPGGLILPSHATLFMAPITNSERYEGSVDFWCDVYGINMSALVPLAKKFTYEEPSIEIIGGENVISWPSVVKHIDCYNFTAEEFKSITAKYKVSSMMLAPIHGFGFWFEVEFNGPAESSQNVPSNLNPLEIIQKKRRRSSEDTVLLSTAPEDEPTHWQQTILYFPDPMEVKQDRTVEGSVTVSQSTENPRFLNIHLECSTGGQTLVKDCVMR